MDVVGLPCLDLPESGDYSGTLRAFVHPDQLIYGVGSLK